MAFAYSANIMNHFGTETMKKTKEFPFNIFAMAFAVVMFLIGGLWIGYESHPYERCARMHNSPDSIGECVWFLEN
jgi:hypothetical protein